MAVINGNNGSNNLFGGANADLIRGFAEDDVIRGLGGNDSIYGGEGDDLIDAGSGDDRIYGDRFQFQGDPDLVQGPLSYNDEIHGNDGNDVIFGEQGNNRLFGDQGNDLIRGGSEGDRIEGGSGNDRLLGNDGNDDVYGNEGRDHLEGGEGNDRLYGDEGSDRLIGGQGNDVLIGVNSNADNPGQGDVDALIGGSDSDKFILGRIGAAFYDDEVIEAGNEGTTDYAIVRDFIIGDDIIQLKGNEDYILQNTTVNGVSGAGIYIDQGPWFNQSGQLFQARELVGVVAGVDAADLTVNDGGPLMTIV